MYENLNFFVRWVSFLLITLKDIHQCAENGKGKEKGIHLVTLLYKACTQLMCILQLWERSWGYLVAVSSGWAGAEAAISCASPLVPVFRLCAVHTAHLWFGILEYRQSRISEYLNSKYQILLCSVQLHRTDLSLARICEGELNLEGKRLLSIVEGSVLQISLYSIHSGK